MKISTFSALAMLPLLGAAVDADEPEGPHSSADWQIWAYASAAPAPLGERATILGTGGTVLREGTNGWTCMAGNPRLVPDAGWANAHEAMPMCTDAEGMKWMQAFAAGVAPEMERDTFMWMLHGDVGEDNTTPMVLDRADSTPGEWIESGPHLMLLPKDPESLAAYPTDFNTGAPYAMFPGTPAVHLMIPVRGYYEYQAPAETP